MQKLSKWNRGYKYLLMVLDLFSKYGWIVPLKTKTGLEVSKAFKSIFKKNKPKMLWVDKGKEHYNKNVLDLLAKDKITIYSTENEEKSSVCERNKNNDKPAFVIGDRVRIRKYKRMTFDKGYTPNWTEEVFIIDGIQFTNPITYKIKDLNGEAIKGTFYREELQKTDQEVYRIEKIIRKRGDKALVKWKGYPDEFNSWVPLKDLKNL